MTSALVDERVDDLTEFEFAKTCEFHSGTEAPPCPNAAEWLVWVKHSGKGTPDKHEMENYLCTQHKEWVIEQLAIGVRLGAICVTCRTNIRGMQLGDIVKAIAI